MLAGLKGANVMLFEDQILQSTARFWLEECKPLVAKNSCILASRTIIEVLRYHGIKAEALAVNAMAYNDEMWEILGSPPEHWTPRAWSVGCSNDPRTSGTFRNDRSGGYAGHLVVVTRRSYVDFTADQFDRPFRDIVTGSPLIVGLDNLQDHPHGLLVPIEKGKMLVMPNNDDAFKYSPDWRFGYKDFAGWIIRKQNLTGVDKSA
jgi:hypothetical protein